MEGGAGGGAVVEVHVAVPEHHLAEEVGGGEGAREGDGGEGEEEEVADGGGEEAGEDEAPEEAVGGGEEGGEGDEEVGADVEEFGPLPDRPGEFAGEVGGEGVGGRAAVDDELVADEPRDEDEGEDGKARPEGRGGLVAVGGEDVAGPGGGGRGRGGGFAEGMG